MAISEYQPSTLWVANVPCPNRHGKWRKTKRVKGAETAWEEGLEDEAKTATQTDKQMKKMKKNTEMYKE